MSLVGHFSQTFRSLRVRNYRLYYCGQLFSMAGTWMQNIALSWLVYRLTHSTEMLGVVSFFGMAPVILFGVLGGYFVDHFDRRKILLFTQSASLIQASLLACLTLTGLIQIWQILLLAFILGTINAIDSPCRQAFVADLVGSKDIVNAVGLSSSLFHGSRVIGPALAGVLIAAIGEVPCFAINALSFFGLLLALLAMHDVHHHKERHAKSEQSGFFDAFQFVRTNWLAKAVLFSSGSMCFLVGQYIVLLPVFAHDVFHGNASAFGLLSSVTAIGAVIATLTIARWGARSTLLSGVGIANFISGIALILFSCIQQLNIAVFAVLFVGLSNTIGGDGSTSLLQLTAPNKIRGRVMSLYISNVYASIALGSLLAGYEAHWFGASKTIFLSGCLCLISALIYLSLPKDERGTRRKLVYESDI